jgi:hypothetical protein
MMAHDAYLSGAVVVPVGSRVTCDPPPTDTDEDYLVLVKDRQTAVAGLKAIGFEYSSTPEQVEKYEQMNISAQWKFTSLWFGDINYIVTDSQFFFERFLTATHVCKTLNLLKKEDRIMVFEAIRGGTFYHKMETGWHPPYGAWVKHEKSDSMHTDGLVDDLTANVIHNSDNIALGAQSPKPLPF